MSRQEATNTFNGGMVKDMNPLTTPNTVLTDCVNGTLITYNGNEFVLQNDMGNYRLGKARLTTDFVPVGIREYGNIIYIVSYNPITNECEVGSYPSPQTIFGTSDITDNPSEKAISAPEPSKDSTYNELTEECKLFIYSVDENYKLNPGDKFYLYNELYNGSTSLADWIALDHYVLDDDKKLFRIDLDKKYIHTVAPIKVPNREEFDTVKWNIPGYLCAKYRIANLDSFNIYLTSLSYPTITGGTNNKLTFGLNIQLTTSDPLFFVESLQKKLKLEFKIDEDLNSNLTSSKRDEIKTILTTKFSEIEIGKIKYGESNLLLYFTSESIEISGIEIDKLVITVYPKLELVKEAKNIHYTQFSTNFEINTKAAGNINDIRIGSSYKYLVSDNEVSINFTIDGPFPANSNYDVKYTIYGFDIDSSNKLKLQDSQYTGIINGPNLHGQNIITIPISNTLSSAAIAREDIYICRFYIEDLDFTVDKYLITSSLMNSFYSSVEDFSTIKADYWLGQLSESKYIELSSKVNYTITNGDEIDTSVVFPSYYTEKKELHTKKDPIVKQKGHSKNLTTKIPTDFSIGTGTGRLWNNINKKASLLCTYNNIKETIDLTNTIVGGYYTWTKNFKAYKYSEASIRDKEVEIPHGTKKYLYNYTSGWNSKKTTTDINILCQGNQENTNFVEVWDEHVWDSQGGKYVEKMLYTTGTNPWNKGEANLLKAINKAINTEANGVNYKHLEDYLLFTFRILGRGTASEYNFDDLHKVGGDSSSTSGGFGCFIKLKSDSGWRYAVIPVASDQPSYTVNDVTDPKTYVHSLITQIGEHIYVVTNVKNEKYIFMTPELSESGVTPSTFSFSEVILQYIFNSIKYLNKYDILQSAGLKNLSDAIKGYKVNEKEFFNIEDSSNLTLDSSLTNIEVSTQLAIPDTIIIDLSDIAMGEFDTEVANQYDKAIKQQDAMLETAQVGNQVVHDLEESGYMGGNSDIKNEVKDSYDKFISTIYYDGTQWWGKDGSLYFGWYGNPNGTTSGFAMYSLKNINHPTLPLYDIKLDNFKIYE